MTTAPDTEAENIASEATNEEDESLGTQSEIERLGSCKLKVKAQVPADKVTELLDKNYRDLISSLELPGFRRGRVPRDLVEKRYGGDIEKDLKEGLLNDSFLEVVQENELKIVGRPKFDEISFEKDQPFSYEADVEVRPEFDIEKYKGIEVEREEPELKDEEIDKEIDRLRERNATLQPVERGEAEADDWYLGSYRLLDGDTEIQESGEVAFKPSDKEIASFAVEELPDAVSRLGDEKVLKIDGVKVPDVFPEESLRGKDVNMEVTIEETKRLQLPEVDDDFAKALDIESADKLRSEVRESLEARNRHAEDQKVEERVIEKIESELDFELPEGLIDDQKKSHKVRLQHQLIQMGRSKDEIEEELKKAETMADDDIRKEVKRHFILEAIAEKEKVFATEDDVQGRILALAQVYQRKPEEIVQELQQTGRLEELRVDIRHGKVRQILREKAKVSGNGASTSDEPKAAETAEKTSEETASES